MDKETPEEINPPLVDIPIADSSLVDGPTSDPPLVNDPPLFAKGACHKREMTSRNVSPQKQSANIQAGCQLANIVEKAIHHQKNRITQAEIDVEELEYAYDVVGTYADEVTMRLDDIVKCDNGSYAATKRLVNVGVLKESIGKLTCGQFAKSTVYGLEDETMKKFRQCVSRDGVNATTNDLIDRFRESILTNKSGRMNQVENKYKVDFNEDVMGISSDMYIQCKSKTDHCYPLTFIRQKRRRV